MSHSVMFIIELLLRVDSLQFSSNSMYRYAHTLAGIVGTEDDVSRRLESRIAETSDRYTYAETAYMTR